MADRRRTGEPSDARDGPIVRDVTGSTATVRIVGRDRWSVALTALIAVFLGGALLKPWVGPGVAPGPPAETPSSARATTGLGPSIAPDPLAALREHCQEPIGWRVYSRETWLGRPVRTWRSLEPAASAVGPDDPAIPTVALGPYVEALGYCSPWDGAERPPAAARISAWQASAGAAAAAGVTVPTGLTLEQVAPGVQTVLGALYEPIGAGRPSARAATDGRATDHAATAWPAGRSIFALRASGWERWWAVEIAMPDGPPVAASAGPPVAASGPP
ncbi:MAG: hypothetical protein ABIZ72_05820 [Candidatus Limnocylindrales bacterium]